MFRISIPYLLAYGNELCVLKYISHAINFSGRKIILQKLIFYFWGQKQYQKVKPVTTKSHYSVDEIHSL